MKRLHRKFRIALITLALGLASVDFMNWLDDYWNTPRVELPQVENGSLLEVLIIDEYTGRNNVFDIKDANAFSPIGHGCGGRNEYGGESSGTGYKAYNRQNIGTFSSGYDDGKSAKLELDLRIKAALEILEDNQNSKSKKQHTVLKTEDNKVEIIDYDGKGLIETERAPSLKLLREFEEWKKYRNW